MHTLNPTVTDLENISGTKITLSWQSYPKLKGGKGNPMQGNVRKVSTAVVTLSGTGLYAMKKVQEGEFKSVTDVQERKWGVRRGNGCIIEHKGAEYVEFYVESKPVTTYFLGENTIDKGDITGLNDRPHTSDVVISCIKAENLLAMSDAPADD